MKQKLLITGGLGFQGSHLADHFLRAGHEVTVLNTLSDRARRILEQMPEQPRVVWGSVTDRELVEKTVRDHDTVFHLAAYVNVDQSLKDPRPFVGVNVLGTLNVLEAVRANRNRLIYTSSCEVYGTALNRARLTEAAELRPRSVYASSKAAADRLCFSYAVSFGTDVAIVRPFNIFGPRQKEEEFGALIPLMVRRAMDKKDLIIFGDGKQTRDYMYIDDLVRAYDAVFRAKRTAGEAYNFGTGKATAVKDIAEHIARHFDVRVRHEKARPGEVQSFRADMTQAKNLFKFAPQVSIKEGIDRYIQWRTAA